MVAQWLERPFKTLAMSSEITRHYKPSAIGPFYLVSMPGDVNDQSGSKYILQSAQRVANYVTRRGENRVVYYSEPGRSTFNVLNYKYKYFPPRKYLSTSTFLFGEMYLSTFRVLSKCTFKKYNQEYISITEQLFVP